MGGMILMNVLNVQPKVRTSSNTNSPAINDAVDVVTEIIGHITFP